MKAVVVGAGGISGAWFPHLIREGIEVVGVVDINRDTAKERVKQYDIKPMISTNLKSVLRKTQPDFIVDLTIPDAHCKVTCTALGMGSAVIGEKPMAASMKEAQKMVKASEASGKLYMVSQSRRYDKTHAELSRLLRGGKIGDMTTMNCAFYIGAHFGGFRDAMESPLILDMAIHLFDMARLFCGADPVSVYAREFNPKGSWYKGDAAASCIFEMSNGAVSTFTGSWCAEWMDTSWNGDWRFIGDRGAIVYERDQKPQGQVSLGVDASRDTFFSQREPFTVEPPEMAFGGMHGALREFMAAINGGAAPQGECHDNIKSLAMVFAAVESSRKGKKINIKW